MSQPPQDPQAYPWGAGEPHGASPMGSAPDREEPASSPQGDARGDDPYGGGQYAGTPYTGTPSAGTGVGPLTGYQGRPASGAEGGSAPTSTIVLLAVSGVSLVTGAFTLAGIAGLVLSIVALVRSGTDLPAARRLTRIGWIIWTVVAVLSVLLVIGLIALLVAASDAYDPTTGPTPLPGLSTALGLG